MEGTVHGKLLGANRALVWTFAGVGDAVLLEVTCASCGIGADVAGIRDPCPDAMTSDVVSEPSGG